MTRLPATLPAVLMLLACERDGDPMRIASSMEASHHHQASGKDERDRCPPPERRPGIVVEILDARTGEPAAAGAELTWTDGRERGREVGSRTLNCSDPVALGTAHERPGIYRVEVQKAGYQPWYADSVFVRRGRCHLEGVALEASLEPVGSLK